MRPPGSAEGTPEAGFLSALGLGLAAGRTGARGSGTLSSFRGRHDRARGQQQSARIPQCTAAPRPPLLLLRRRWHRLVGWGGACCGSWLRPSCTLWRSANLVDCSSQCPFTNPQWLRQSARTPLSSRAHVCGCNSLLAARRGEGTAGDGLRPRHAEDVNSRGKVGGGQGLGLFCYIPAL